MKLESVEVIRSLFLICLCFLVQPTGHISGPIRTLNGSNDVNRLIHVQGLDPQIHF